MAKRDKSTETPAEPPAKKQKTSKKSGKKPAEPATNAETAPKGFEKKAELSKKDPAQGPKKFSKPTGGKGKPGQPAEKPEDWNEFKKKKKELRLKRKQSKTGFDIIVKAKQMCEQLRCKKMGENLVERNKLLNEMHSMLKGQDLYAKFVVAHDTARIVQWLLKYGSSTVKEQISRELVPVSLDMLQSRYGVHCVRRLLKFGSAETRKALIDTMYGHAIKLCTHSVSAPVLEFAFSQFATPVQRQHLCQEFYGDLYKNSKDDGVKHLRDVFEKSPDLKAAMLGATKANLMRVINKGLLDSELVHIVLHQYLGECSPEDKAEFISLLTPHIVVISNSKDGARVAMQCIWHGTNKDRKSTMKTLKEHVTQLARHETGYCTVIALLDAADDTVLLHKAILGEILKNARDLAVSEFGRKVLLWLVAPADPTFFHPVFVKELEEGRSSSTAKKSVEIRRKEILEYSSKILVGLVEEDPKFWLQNSSLAYEMLAILKSGDGKELKAACEAMMKVITDPQWKVKENETEVAGIEAAGLHIVLKKLVKQEGAGHTFAACLAAELTEDNLDVWLQVNRGCFLLVHVLENSSEDTQKVLKDKLSGKLKVLKKLKTPGANILKKKLE